MASPPVYGGDGCFECRDGDGGLLVGGYGAEAVDIHVMTGLALPGPVLTWIGFAGEDSPEHDSGFVVARSQHVEAVAFMGFFPFIDTPVEAEAIGAFCGGTAVGIQPETADGRVPTEDTPVHFSTSKWMVHSQASPSSSGSR